MMKTVVLALVVLAVVVTGSEEDRRHAAQERLHEYRVVNQNLHLDLLEKEIEELEEEFENLTPFPEDEEVDELKARLHNLHNDTCNFEEDGEVSCGGDVPQCISRLFVCDGHEDCDNGYDEDDETCSDEAYQVGATLTGITEWHDCIAHEPHNTVITITANTVPEAYPSLVYVKAIVSFELDEDVDLVETHKTKGFWSPARRALVLIPEDVSEGALGIVCRFIYGNNYKAECKIRTIASKHECAEFIGEHP